MCPEDRELLNRVGRDDRFVTKMEHLYDKVTAFVATAEKEFSRLGNDMQRHEFALESLRKNDEGIVQRLAGNEQNIITLRKNCEIIQSKKPMRHPVTREIFPAMNSDSKGRTKWDVIFYVIDHPRGRAILGLCAFVIVVTLLSLGQQGITVKDIIIGIARRLLP